MKIVVLAGGFSKERDVSMASGSLIANALLENGHEVILVDLYKGIDSKVDNNQSNKFLKKDSNITYQYTIDEKEPDLTELKEKYGCGNSLIGYNVLELCEEADVVFNALHGGAGENGQIQAFFDVLGINYTGTGYTGALLAMDKNITKLLLKSNLVLTPNWITKNVDDEDISDVISSIGLPCIIKPCRNGSSVGISFIDNEIQLRNALEDIKAYETEVIIEEIIKGREFSVGILNNKVLPVIEIIPKEGFYDYKNKYQLGGATEICPAILSNEETKTVQDIALKVHNILKLGCYSRIDFILDEKGNFTCLEANTLPGMTPTSLLPQEAKAAGISYNELCEKIVSSAIKEEGLL